jgi:mannose-6-phosphate isomerase-like protein (cupin superfamily)
MNKIVLRDKFALFDRYWSPHIVAAINDYYVKLAKLKGEMVWHNHEHEDEFFHVIEGRLTLQFRDATVVLEKGECLVVPKGVDHKPIADEETHVLLVEKNSTQHTGKVRSHLTVAVEDQPWI